MRERKIKGKILGIEYFPYKILDVMRDEKYLEFFLYRFKVARDLAMSQAKKCSWIPIYANNPELMYYDALDEIEAILDKDKPSAAAIKLGQRINTIVLPAVGDWLTWKLNRTPRFEAAFARAPHQRPTDLRLYRFNHEEERKRTDLPGHKYIDLGCTSESET